MSQAVKNRTTKTVLCQRKKVLSTVFQQARGLMFRRKITETAYIFTLTKPRRIDLHMFFVFFPIDVLFLDEDKKIVEMKEGFLPFTF